MQRWRMVRHDWNCWMFGPRYDVHGPMVLLGPWAFSPHPRRRHIEVDAHASEGYIVFFSSATKGLFMQFEPRSFLLGGAVHGTGFTVAIGQTRFVYAAYEITGPDSPSPLFRRPRWRRSA